MHRKSLPSTLKDVCCKWLPRNTAANSYPFDGVPPHHDWALGHHVI